MKFEDKECEFAHKHSSNHRSELLASEKCGCFNCLETFPPASISEWCDDENGVGQTAICPKCGIDAVIGNKSGYQIYESFLKAMNAYWFEGSCDE